MRENNLISPEPQPTVTPPVIKPKFKISGIVLGLIIGILFTSTSAAAYYFIFIKNLERTPPLLTMTPLPSPIINTTPAATPSATPDGEYGKISWESIPVKVANPDILAKQGDMPYSFDESGTYQVAKFSSGAELLVSFIRGDGPGLSNIFRIIKQNNQFFLIESLIIDKYIKPELTKIFDKTKIKFISYDTLGLLPSDYIIADNKVVFISGASLMSSQFFPDLKNPIKIASSTYGDIYSIYSEAYKSSNILGREFFLKLPDSTILVYKPELTFFFDDKVPKVTISGVVNKDGYEPGIPFKCGLGAATTVIKDNSSILADKQEIGFLTNSQNEKIYQIKNSQNELIKVLYENYKIGRDYPSSPPYLSLDQYISTNTHFLYQDKLGEWIVFVNSQYAPMVECGKPVIYLYPEKDTQVSVKVAADITVSEPKYPLDGWTVLAHPNGQLEYQSKTYPNLFWEGKGQGIYPNIKNYGFVISQQNLISTIKKHLSLLGLNTQETADFLEFWTDKLPTTPYVRLTWLGTADMNRLAPLEVTPRPDTIIRVFLDFEGLVKPVTLIPQKLTSVPRKGFTLIEWGGLLIK